MIKAIHFFYDKNNLLMKIKFFVKFVFEQILRGK